MHHKKRYNHQFCLKVWFYGEEIDEADKQTAQKLVKANAVNLYCSEVQIRFMETAGPVSYTHLVLKTEEYMDEARHRPSQYYRFNPGYKETYY